MRLFAAIVPPDEVLADLEEHLTPRIEASDGIRWTDPSQWHITLAFSPSAPDRLLDDLGERLGHAGHRSKRFSLAILGAGTFPNPYAARILWAGVADPAGGLSPLGASVRNAFNKAGATPDGTRFHPHVTLGRFRRPTEATRWIRALSAYEGPEWRVGAVHLIESHLGEGRGRRPRYEVVGEFPLA
ncbi:MAG: RNA 2',3'-cyclic phosphodiesterase [Intrasporangium sp.]|uniref:RNA 2',3'-cyclic phosphodiesterase n=1 Tax=Intrasporangium sp. TaxID=1925024 RepID=UPI003F7D11DE